MTPVSFGGRNTFSPWRIDHLIALSCVKVDLLDSPCTGTLESDHLLHSREPRLVHEVVERERVRKLH